MRYFLGGLMPASPKVSAPVARLAIGALSSLSTSAYFTGELTSFVWSHLENLAVAEHLGDPAERAEVYGKHVMFLTAIPVPLLGRAERFARRATELAQGAGAARVQSSALMYSGYLEMFCGRYAASGAAFEGARRGARAVGDFLNEYFGALGLVTIDIRTGKTDRARERVQEILRGVGELGRGDATARTDYYLAEIGYWQGRDELASEHCDRAMAVMRELNDRQLVARVWWIRAALDWRRGRREEALRHAKEAVAYIERNGLHVDFVTQTLCQLGHLALVHRPRGARPRHGALAHTSDAELSPAGPRPALAARSPARDARAGPFRSRRGTTRCRADRARSAGGSLPRDPRPLPDGRAPFGGGSRGPSRGGAVPIDAFRRGARAAAWSLHVRRAAPRRSRDPLQRVERDGCRRDRPARSERPGPRDRTDSLFRAVADGAVGSGYGHGSGTHGAVHAADVQGDPPNAAALTRPRWAAKRGRRCGKRSA
jgi:tetratricopeptide (TPR) repeat protein